MKITRYGSLVGVAMVATLTLTACGSDNTPAAGSSTGTSSIACKTGSIKASGSSAQKNAMAAWITAYQTACPGATIEYSPSGSGAGIADFTKGQVAFAGSDSALKPEEQGPADARCKTGKAINIPMVVGPIAVAYNLSGVSKLVLTPSVLAKIFSNQITKWDDAAITALNPGVTLPSATIAQFHRSDSSGTSDNFTKYLTAASGGAWTYDHSKDWKAPGGQGAKGSDGVAAALKSTPNSIGYIEYSFTKEGGLGVAQIDNGGGAVTLTPETAGKALEAATIKGTGNDLTLSLDYATKDPGAYPVVLVTYEITSEKGLTGADLDVTKSFLTYTASADGQSKLTGLGYAPLPASLDVKVQASVAAIS